MKYAIVHDDPTQPDQPAAVTIPAPGWLARTMADGKTEEEAMQICLALHKERGRVPAAAVVVERAAILSDRTFRNAWEAPGGKIVVNMSKARNIHRDRLRAARAPLLASLDIQSTRALETQDGAELSRVAAEKQKLRDLPADSRIEAAKTPEQLKALTFAVLAGS